MKLSVHWDEHTDKVSRRSSRWASTDRGWLFPGPRGAAGSSLGHYLDYGPCGEHFAREHDGCTVHAVVCGEHVSRWCRDVEEAKRWIESFVLIPFAWRAVA